MEQKNLTGYSFMLDGSTEYQVLAGYEGAEIVCEEIGNTSPLLFCCDARIIGGKLKVSYRVSYTVSKVEFFAEIESLCEEKKRDADTIAAALREKYYKIPTVFLVLVGEVYLKREIKMDDIIKAHEYSSYNYDTLKKGTLCGCFYCCEIFDSAKITDWTPEPDGSKTALCPYCSIDSVIGESSGHPITQDFLEEMKKHWFG